MKIACVALNLTALVLVLIGAALVWRGVKVGRLTYGDFEDASKLSAKLDPAGRIGIVLATTGAVLNTAASIWSLYLPQA